MPSVAPALRAAALQVEEVLAHGGQHELLVLPQVAAREQPLLFACENDHAAVTALRAKLTGNYLDEFDGVNSDPTILQMLHREAELTCDDISERPA